MGKTEVLRVVLEANGYTAEDYVSYGENMIHCWPRIRKQWAHVVSHGLAYGVSTTGSMITVDDAQAYLDELTEATELAKTLNNILTQEG